MGVTLPVTALDKYWDDFKKLVTAHPPTLAEGQTLEQMMQTTEAAYTKAAAVRTNRAHFESQIKRSYFHVRPLDDAQLQNWRQYLQFLQDDAETSQLDVRRVFDRCLVACINYLDSAGLKEDAKAVAKRATEVNLPQNPAMHGFTANLHEVNEDFADAREVYQRVVDKLAPGMVEPIVNLANFERRQGQTAAVLAVYEKGIETVSTAESKAFLSMHYARYLTASCGDAAKCREVYQKAS